MPLYISMWLYEPKKTGSQFYVGPSIWITNFLIGVHFKEISMYT